MQNFIAKNISSYGEDETTVSVIHRHWFDILINFFLIILMILFIIGGYLFLPLIFPALETNEFHALFIFFESSFSMLTLLLFFLVWIDFYFDVWIVTTKRIINIEQKGLFSREVSELELDRIQDVSVDVRGVIPTFLNYGNVFIQTAGEKERFVFKKIANPYLVKDMIMSLEKNNEKRIEKEKAISEAREMKSAFQNSSFK